MLSVVGVRSLGSVVSSLLLGASVALAGCTSENPAGQGSGGAESAGTGGTAGAPSAGGGGTGSGEGPADVPRGAVSFFFPAAPGCALVEQWLDFPPVAAGHPVTATERRASIEDRAIDEEGIGISRLTCTWRPTFASVGFRYGRAGNEGFVSISPDKVRTPVEKGLVVSGPDWNDISYGGTCTFTTLEVDESTRSIWGGLTCGALGIIGEEAKPCVIAYGYYSFENCTLGE